jgi:ABC-type antimicrobial peptide transport system permease subunit
LLASIGLYGVMAYYVTQRTFEIGLRISLGSNTRGIMKLVFGRAAQMVSVGLVIGLAGSLAGTRLIRQLLYETTPTDPLTLVAVSVCLAAVCFVASAAPAWRASRIQPVQALRNE